MTWSLPHAFNKGAKRNGVSGLKQAEPVVQTSGGKTQGRYKNILRARGARAVERPTLASEQAAARRQSAQELC
jgi:hypothetical protein